MDFVCPQYGVWIRAKATTVSLIGWQSCFLKTAPNVYVFVHDMPLYLRRMAFFGGTKVVRYLLRYQGDPVGNVDTNQPQFVYREVFLGLAGNSHITFGGNTPGFSGESDHSWRKQPGFSGESDHFWREQPGFSGESDHFWRKHPEFSGESHFWREHPLYTGQPEVNRDESFNEPLAALLQVELLEVGQALLQKLRQEAHPLGLRRRDSRDAARRRRADTRRRIKEREIERKAKKRIFKNQEDSVPTWRGDSVLSSGK